MPSAPSATASTSGESGSTVTTTSASRTASATLPAPRPPRCTSRSTFAGLRLYPTTSNPARTRLAAIGPPMIPRPMKPTLVIAAPVGHLQGYDEPGADGDDGHSLSTTQRRFAPGER